MSKVLVIEKIRALLKERFVGDSISFDSVPVIEQAMQQFLAPGYDVLIWDAVTSKTEHAKDLELHDPSLPMWRDVQSQSLARFASKEEHL